MEAKVTFFSSKKTLNLQGKLYDLSRPLVMGILNVTPDSFYDGDKFLSQDKMALQIQLMLEQGVDIIDIGGYSSRPGAEDITVQEELERVLPAIELVRSLAAEIPISIDTYRTEVAGDALKAGAAMINDISGGDLDPKMFKSLATWKVPYVLMHMRGNPRTMSKQTDYHDVVGTVVDDFVQKINKLVALGVSDIILDPGFGFAKSIDQNYTLLRNLSYFKELNFPVLAGLSRKSMIYKPLQATARDALNGTTVLNTIALMNGASILRVHDVRAAREAVQFFKLTYP